MRCAQVKIVVGMASWCYGLVEIVTLRGIRSRLALKVEGLARVSKNAGGRPRLASVASDGRYMGLAL